MFSWLDAEQRAMIFICQHIQQAIGPLTDISDALFQIVQHRLAGELFPRALSTFYRFAGPVLSIAAFTPDASCVAVPRPQ